jgi:hypothetical protein
MVKQIIKIYAENQVGYFNKYLCHFFYPNINSKDVVQINGSIDIGTVSNEIVLINNTILHITDYTSISIFEFSNLKISIIFQIY